MSNIVPVGSQAIQTSQQGGAGLDFRNKLFNLKPATININQPNTQAEGAIPGKLRITDTGEQFDSMDVIFLSMPTEGRQWYEGEPGQLNRTKENLMCFSTDMIRPHANAKVPQALKCEGCPKASWERWRQDPRPKPAKRELIPPCEAQYKALFLDTMYQLPLRMFIRSKQKGPFEQGCQELARKFRLLQAEAERNGKPLPNIYDIRFKLSTRKMQEGKLVTYVPHLSEFKVVTAEEREKFGAIFLEFANIGKRSEELEAEIDAVEQMEKATATIDAQVVEPGAEGPNVQTGEIVI